MTTKNVEKGSAVLTQGMLENQAHEEEEIHRSKLTSWAPIERLIVSSSTSGNPDSRVSPWIATSANVFEEI